MEKYFAAKPANEIAEELMTRIEDYYEHLSSTGRMALWRRSYDYYHRALGLGARLQKTGPQAEFTTVSVGHYRNLIQHLVVMTTTQRPAFEPRATNTDYKSMAQTILAAGLLDYYLREKRLERVLKQAVEHGIVFAEGFVHTQWDATSGAEYHVDPETQSPIREGDIKYSNLNPLDVIRDFTKDSAADHSWLIIREPVNRFELAAKYPDLQEKILALPSKLEESRTTRLSQQQMEKSEDVYRYTFYHQKEGALREGRVLVFCSGDCVLLDGPLPYRKIPVYRLAPAEQTGSPFGYSVAFDLLPLQEAADGLYSTVITNQSSFGVQNIWVPRGHGLSLTSLQGGMNIIEGAPDKKPEPMNLTATPPEIFNFIQQVERTMETISGVNSVARGNPEASLKSGAALALVQSMALQFSSGLQQSYAQLLEDVGTATITILRDFAKVPRVAMIAGKSNRPFMKEFKGDDLDQINRVTVDFGNPLSRTAAGRLQVIESMKGAGVAIDMDQYQQIIETGKMDPVLEGQRALIMHVRSENEDLAEGKAVPVSAIENHAFHIAHHKTLVEDPDSKRSPELAQAVLGHIQEHIAVWKSADPSLLAVLGIPPFPMAPMLPPANEPMAGPGPSAAGPLGPMEIQMPAMPNGPQNPLSGERVEIPAANGVMAAPMVG